jgi:FMN phosphatase YigB (HAD superfamily)
MDGPILPQDLATAIDAFPDIGVLSLDCFDTLLWRDCHAPADVFQTLEGLNPRQRGWAERAARIEASFRHDRSEVKLPEIYRQLFPNAGPAALAAHAAAEVAAEHRFCFGFLPTIALMRRARARGLKIIIVSDTYLDHDELAGLIGAAAGADVLALIDTIYCSSEHGVSKGGGLLKTVVRLLGVTADTILHIGDNAASDYAAARAAGINALHLVQFTPAAEQRLRLEAAVSAMLHSRAGAADLAWQPHRATLAAGEPGLGDAAAALGYTVLGPVLSGFADWLGAERAALAAGSETAVHTLFLMRDGFLPREVFEAGPDRAGTSHAVEISRFTATGMAFVDAGSIRNFAEQNVGSGLEYLLTQLLYTPDEIAKFLRDLPQGRDRSPAFMRRIGGPQMVNRTVARSKALATRLCAHLMAVANPKPGDTLMLVDLGYNGSVQNLVEPILRCMLGVRIAGRYLLYRAQQNTGYDKAGFIDERQYDIDTLLALAANVAVVEQLCTVAQGSVIDYGRDGTPIRAGSVIKGRQSDVRNRIQAGCIAFARDRDTAVLRPCDAHGNDARRRAAASILARLMFLPQRHELDVIAQFEHDVNLGTAGTVKLFDPEAAERGLKQRGLFYLKSSDRMYLPAELHGQGLATSLSMLALKRFNLGLTFADFSDRTITVPLLVADGHEVAVETIVATPTHDGYFVAAVPIGASRFTVALQFGKLYDVVEIHSVQFRPVAVILNRAVAPGTDVVTAAPTLEGMAELAPHIFHCGDRDGFMMVPPPAGAERRDLVLEVVFRPIAERPPVAATTPNAIRIGTPS